MKANRSGVIPETIIITNLKAEQDDFIRTKMIVWIGSSKYWNYVYLRAEDHRLYIKTDRHTYTTLDSFNIAKVETI